MDPALTRGTSRLVSCLLQAGGGRRLLLPGHLGTWAPGHLGPAAHRRPTPPGCLSHGCLASAVLQRRLSPWNSFLQRHVSTSLSKGGDAKLLVIVCVSPSEQHVAETLQSLGFGARARQVERQVQRGRPARRRPR